MSESGGEGDSAMTISNDQKLAHFQEVTHLDDFDQCQAILESTNWDLDQAIQSYFATQFAANDDDNQQNTVNRMMNTEVVEVDDDIEITASAPPLLPQPLSSMTTTTTTTIFPPIVNINEQHQETLDSVFNNLSTHNFGIRATTSRRLLTFKIEYLNEKFTLYLPDTETVGKLKELISEKIDIPRKHIKLNGWPSRQSSSMPYRFISDSCTLSDLNLPLETSLSVVNMQTVADDIQNAISHLPGASFAIGSTSASTSRSSSSDSFELYIKLVNSGDDKIHRLHFSGETTFLELRRRLAMLTKLVANDQEWWYFKPVANGDEEQRLADFKAINSVAKFDEAQSADKLLGVALDSIAEDGLALIRIRERLDELLTGETATTSSKSSNNKNKLFFVIKSRTADESGANPGTSGLNEQQKTPTSLSDYVFVQEGGSNQAANNVVNLDDYETGEDALMHNTQDEDIEDHFILNEDEEETSNKRKALITTDCPVGDELTGTLTFRDEFLERYGPLIPLFYTGKLEDAIKDALVCPARDRRLLGIYLHSDHTVFCNIFASKTLCDETVINFLSSNFVVWPWDMTHKQHETHFYEVFAKFFGSTIASTLSRQHRDKMPLFVIVTRVRSSNEIVAIVEGDSTSDQMMQRLMQCSEMFEAQRSTDERDERERDERERIKREQDQAYQESLENDKAKRQRHAAEEENRRREREREEAEERLRLEAVERRKADALARLATEPEPNAPQVAKIRFRLPDGETWQRRFGAKEKLSSVIDFVTSQGYFPDEYKLLSSWPRRDLTSESLDKSLEELKLYPQETLTLEQR